MTKQARQDLRALLAQTEALERKFATHSPGGSRHRILCKDVARLRAELARA